jgi:starch synthase
MRVLIAASEVSPIIKLGGLGDVIGSLPKALANVGVNADVVVPFFPHADLRGVSIYKTFDLNVSFDGEVHVVEVYKTKLSNSNVDVFLLSNAHFFSQKNPRAFANTSRETDMFTFFSRAVVDFIKLGFNTYNVIHCNDWHTGLIPHLLEEEFGSARPASLFTIHNLMYQGIGSSELVKDVGIAPGTHRLIDWDLSDGNLNLMLQGITSSDCVSTVSPQYAKEIMTNEFGGSFSDILKEREERVVGILNGVGYDSFPRDFNMSNWEEKKRLSKAKLQKELGLEQAPDKPIFSVISRLDPYQKGLDILYEAIPSIIDNGGQFVLLGTGDPSWEKKFSDLKSSDISCNIKFDANLARIIYAGSDFLVIPSKYEPCGLIQMIAMWNGTLPVAHAVGGLKDTILDNITGITFKDYSTKSLVSALKQAFNIYGTEKMPRLIERALKQDFSWNKSAAEYKKLYEKLTNKGGL